MKAVVVAFAADELRGDEPILLYTKHDVTSV
jgi:hypothetical protein